MFVYSKVGPIYNLYFDQLSDLMDRFQVDN